MRLFLCVLAICALNFPLLLIGCTKTNRPLLRLEMHSDTQTALYIVDQNGAISFGGGMDAVAGRTTWKGNLTSEQLSSLQSLLRNEQPQEASKSLSNRYIIVSTQGDEVQRLVVPISDSPATELYYFLEESTLDRIQSHLDSLPKPSMNVISDRKLKDTPQ